MGVVGLSPSQQRAGVGMRGGIDVVLRTKLSGGLEAGNASVAWLVFRRHTL